LKAVQAKGSIFYTAAIRSGLESEYIGPSPLLFSVDRSVYTSDLEEHFGQIYKIRSKWEQERRRHAADFFLRPIIEISFHHRSIIFHRLSVFGGSHKDRKNSFKAPPFESRGREEIIFFHCCSDEQTNYMPT